MTSLFRYAALGLLMAGFAFANQSVDGHITNSVTGADIPDVYVFLSSNSVGSDNNYRAATDAQGLFHIDNVPEGNYGVAYVARGYRAVEGDPGTAPIDVTANGPVHVEVKLQPRPTMSGRVLDPDRKPVPKAPVWVLGASLGCNQPRCFALRKQVETDAKGEFQIDDIDWAGRWILGASAPPGMAPPKAAEGERLGWAESFYPSVADPALAEPIALQSGKDVFNLDIKLTAVPVHRMRGRVLTPDGKPASGADVAAGKGVGPSLHQSTRADGTFEFDSVPSGDYRVEAVLQSGKTEFWTGRELTVGRDDVDGVELRLTAPFDLRERFVWRGPEGAPAPHPPSLSLDSQAGDIRLMDVKPRMPFSHIDDNGDYILDEVYPGHYKVVFLQQPPPPYYIASVKLGDQDALSDRVSILSAATPLTFTFQSDGGKVQGSVEDCGNAHVVLFPQDDRLFGPAFVHAGICDGHDHYEVTGLRPGEYYAVALANNGSSRATIHDETILNQATRVSVQPNQFVNADLRVIHLQ